MSDQVSDSSQGTNTTHAPKETEDQFTKACRHKGRWINIAVSFGIDLQDAFRVGIDSDKKNFAADNDDDDDDIIDMGDEEKGVLLTVYAAVLDLIPRLKKLRPIRDNADPTYFFNIVNAMQVSCNTARSETIKRIKDNMIRYLAAGRNPVRVGLHYKARGKILSGLNDPDIGRLLIPADDLLEWDADPDFTRAAFNNGNMLITGMDMPVFLYEDYTYNPDDPEEGLFRGSFLVCVLIDILYGSNAVDTKNVRRYEQCRHHCVGDMYDLTTISPQNIAYAAVVARFCLSMKKTWSIKDDCFNYNTFYQAVLQRLSNEEDPWVYDTLSWWNECVFGNEHGKVTPDESNNRNEKLEIFRQRQAERIAASRAANTEQPMENATEPLPNEDGAGPPGLGNTAPPASSNESLPPGPFVTPSTPPSRADAIIDPRLLETPDLVPDNSLVTQTPPQGPQTPGTPGTSARRELSPLSPSQSDIGAETTKGSQGLKRKRTGSNTDQAKTKVAVSRPKRKVRA